MTCERCSAGSRPPSTNARQRDRDPATPPAAGYRAESLKILFGEDGA
jgi:hypothetical protein